MGHLYHGYVSHNQREFQRVYTTILIFDQTPSEYNKDTQSMKGNMFCLAKSCNVYPGHFPFRQKMWLLQPIQEFPAELGWLFLKSRIHAAAQNV